MTEGNEAKEVVPYSPNKEDVDKCYELFRQSTDYIYLTNEAAGKPAHLFLAHFIHNLHFVPKPESKRMKIAGVSFGPKDYFGTYYFVPENVKNMTLLQHSGLVVHEVLHILLSHTKEARIARALGAIFGWAIDMEVNDMVTRMGYQLPEGDNFMADGSNFQCVTATSIPAMLKLEPHLWPERNQEWQYYLNWLLEFLPPEMQEQMRQQDDDHEFEEGDDPGEEDITDGHIGNAIEGARGAAGDDKSIEGIGNLYRAVQRRVKAMKRETDWRKHISEIIGSSGALRDRTRRRFNKHDTLGVVTQEQRASIGVVVDTSASTKRQRGLFMGEIKKVCELFEVDAFIQFTSKGKVGQRIKLSDLDDQEEFVVKGGGGTNLKPGILSFVDDPDEDSNETVNTVLVLSDGDLGMDSLVTPEEMDGINLIWGFTKDVNPFKEHRYAGTIVNLKVDAVPTASS